MGGWEGQGSPGTRKAASDEAKFRTDLPEVAVAPPPAAVAATPEPLPALAGALAGADRLRILAARLDTRDRARTLAALTVDVGEAAEALTGLESLLAYQLVVGCSDGRSESWQGPRRREREREVVWGSPLADGEVALVDANRKIVARLSPYAQVLAPLPSAEPELFLLWRSGRGAARLMAAPWGFERDDERAGTLLAALSTEDSDTAIDAVDQRSPYPGLAAYGAGDADRFVGREREVEALSNRLVRSSLVAVLGPSGVGKSSFIHAGLVPRLGDGYRVLTLRPGRHPMHALASLPPISGDSQDEAGLVARLRELGESAQRGAVIVIDQLEELATLCADPAERTRFAETLAAAADGPRAPVRVVATLRDDFATVIESEDALRGKFDGFVFAAPSPGSLRRIIIEPARRAGVGVDARVVDDMVTAVAGRPASLPLLSFTAAQLWQTRDRSARRITYDAYTDLGGVAGALATYADQVYSSLARRDQDTVRDLFSRLVAADGTRIPSPRRELETVPGAPGVLSHLIDARLLVVRDDEDNTDVVEIVHECLAERWPRLARWRTEDAADRALLADVRVAARRWDDAKHRADLLWRGAAVAELARLAERSQALTSVERAFATESVRAQQRARGVGRGLVAAVIVVLAGAAVTTAYSARRANDNRAVAERNAAAAAASAQLAEERLTASLIAQGRRELGDKRPLPALAYFGAAMKRGADSTGLRAMVTFASRGWRDVLVTRYAPQTSSMISSPQGWLATGTTDGKVRWWNDQGAEVATLDAGVGAVASVELHGDGLVVAGPKGVVLLDASRAITRRRPIDEAMYYVRPGPTPDELVEVSPGTIHIVRLDGTVVRQIPTEGELVFTGGGRFAVLTSDETVRLVNLVTGDAKVLTEKAFVSPVVSGDGTTWAYVDREKFVRVLRADGTKRNDVPQAVRPSAIVLSRTGDRLGIATDDELAIFDPAGTRVARYDLQREQTVFVIQGEEAWTAGADGVVRHYARGEIVASVPVSATEILNMQLAGGAIATYANDTSFSMMRAGAQQVVYADELCKRVSYSSHGITVGYVCGDTIKVYLGRDHLADYPVTSSELTVDVDRTSQRAVLGGGAGLRVFDKGKLIAKDDRTLTIAAFADADHLFVGDNEALWRWTLSQNTWERILDMRQPDALTSVRGEPVYANGDGELVVLAGAREVARLKIADAINAIVPSWDSRWLAVLDAAGGTSIVDTQTWKVARTLPPADNYGTFPSFDRTGELLLRTSRQSISIWDATTGDELVFGLDILDDTLNARFLPDGRLEIAQREPALVDIPRETRPTAEIVRDIECKVPLEVVGSRIQPKTPTCQ